MWYKEFFPHFVPKQINRGEMRMWFTMGCIKRIKLCRHKASCKSPPFAPLSSLSSSLLSPSLQSRSSFSLFFPVSLFGWIGTFPFSHDVSDNSHCHEPNQHGYIKGGREGEKNREWGMERVRGRESDKVSNNELFAILPVWCDAVACSHFSVNLI